MLDSRRGPGLRVVRAAPQARRIPAQVVIQGYFRRVPVVPDKIEYVAKLEAPAPFAERMKEARK